MKHYPLDSEHAECEEVSIIGLRSVLCLRQHNIGYMGDGFYRSNNPTNSIKVLMEKAVKENNPEGKI